MMTHHCIDENKKVYLDDTTPKEHSYRLSFAFRHLIEQEFQLKRINTPNC